MWSLLAADDACRRLGVDPASGLPAAEAAVRLERFGPNRLSEPPGRPAWRRFADQFRSVLILILVVAALVAALVGDLKDPIVIGAVLLLNATLGFVQEGRAERAMDALKRMLELTARVRRDGEVAEMPAQGLVPGDVILLEAGDRVPADGRLIVASAVSADESALTGESLPVAKGTGVLEGELSLGDRSSELFMNTTLVRGRAELLVTATGMGTQVGRIAEMLADDVDRRTPLERQLDRLGRRLALIAAAAVALVFGLEVLDGESVSEAMLGAVALAVAAIPEGLPAVVTVSLAVGVRQMAHHNAVVRRLTSVETLGSTTVICSDKTGTLTLNEMTAVTVHHGGVDVPVSGRGYDAADGAIGDGSTGDGAVTPSLRRALAFGALCNDATVRDGELIGDPTEGALVTLAHKAGIDVDAVRRHMARQAELPFDSASKVMATVHLAPGGLVLAVKGAPDVLLGACTHVSTPAGVNPLDEMALVGIQSAIDRLTATGQRVLAIASRDLPDDHGARNGGPDVVGEALRGLTLEALVGIVDPSRPEAAAAISVCGEAGIAVKMVTGDHAGTAAAVADQLGIRGRVVSGRELDAMGDAELSEGVRDIGVFARVSPENKVRLVRALQARDEVVAMTGDGVNDAAALRRADIGVAMGRTGTDVTTGASDLVLTDDNFATIVTAVERGRTIYENIVTFVRFQLATNLAAIGTILGATLVGLPTPFTPIQVLYVNLIADGPPAMTLGVDPPKPGTMHRPPLGLGTPILTRSRLIRLLLLAGVMTLGTLAVLAAAEDTVELDVALTMTFTTFVLFQVVNAVNSRAGPETALERHLFTNSRFWLALGAVVGLQVLAVHWAPLQRLFDTTDLTAGQWAICAAVATTVLIFDEIRKLLRRLLRARRAGPGQGDAEREGDVLSSSAAGSPGTSAAPAPGPRPR